MRITRRRLEFELSVLRHDCGRKIEDFWSATSRRLPLGLRRAVIVDAAVRATQPSVIGRDAYAGPDGLEFVDLMTHAATPRDR